jgi:putative ABC transport system substrate-binding protein
VLIAAGALIVAPLARAQPTARSYRVAIVLATSPLSEMAGPDPIHPPTRVILHELRSLGYVEGRNLTFERRTAEGNPARYPEIVAELIRLKTDVMILAPSRDLIRAAQSATRRIPIVLMGYARAVEDGFAASLARPGGNVTGPILGTGWENDGKRLQIFKEMVPGLQRVVYLAPKEFWTGPEAQPVRQAATMLGVELLPVEQHPTDPQASFAAIAQLRVDGLFVAPSWTNYAQREQTGRLAFAARLPASVPTVRIVETGALMSYAPNLLEVNRKVAHYVDKILRGASPGDLPMEQPTRFELIINLKTARALGLKIPQAVLLRTDRVIE